MNFGTESVDREEYMHMGKQRSQVQKTPMTYKRFIVTFSATLLVSFAVLAAFVDQTAPARIGQALIAQVPPYRPDYKTTDTQCSYARILGASWGLNDITRTVAHQYNLGERDFDASRDTWGQAIDTDVKETLTIVYDLCGNVAVKGAKTGETITLP